MSVPAPLPSPGEAEDRAARLGIVRRLARASRSSFLYAFAVLPRPRREAILAVYAFCHQVDDAVDEAPDVATARERLAAWREDLHRAFRGEPAGPVATEAAHAAARFDIPRDLFDQVVDGVAMDVAPRRYRTMDELLGYCDLVAGAVGRISVRIFGRGDEEADRYAADLGAALQLTNILRDIGPDARRGRFYLPLDELARFGLTEDQVTGGDPERLPLLLAVADRARDFYRRAAPVGRRRLGEFYAAEIMGRIYRDLLERVARAGFPVEGPVPRVGRGRKLALALGVVGQRFLSLLHPAPRP